MRKYEVVDENLWQQLRLLVETNAFIPRISIMPLRNNALKVKVKEKEKDIFRRMWARGCLGLLFRDTPRA